MVGATGAMNKMQTVLSGYEAKNISPPAKHDTRSNWVMFMFVSKCRKNVFRKQSSINACKAGFMELERFGFEFGAFGFAGTHVHFAANVPEQYSVRTAKTMLKTWSAKRVFREKPNFRKLYLNLNLFRLRTSPRIRSRPSNSNQIHHRTSKPPQHTSRTGRYASIDTAGLKSPQSINRVIGAEPLSSFYCVMR